MLVAPGKVGGTLGAHAVPGLVLDQIGTGAMDKQTKLGGQPRNIRNVALRVLLACLAPSIPTWWHGARRYRGFARI